MTTTRVTLAAGCALGAFLTTPALAQAADPVTEPAATTVGQPDNASSDIVVTARRQNERLLDVPASVTVLTAKTLEVTGIKTADQFVQLTPGVTIVTGTAEAGDTQINIRGINGARDAESSVALVVDGILKTNTAQLNQDQGTLRQIEVLKGPQGALYGRNAAAGAIVISTLAPGHRLQGGARGSYGSHNTFEGSAYLAGPVSDSAGFVISTNYRKTDGFYRNIFLDSKTVDDQKNFGIDGRFVADLGPATKIDLKARYAKLSGASINFNSSFHLPAFGAFNPAFNEQVDDHPFRYYSNIRPTNDQRTIEASAKVEHDFGAVKLIGWTLYSDIKQDLVADGTSADFARYIAPALGAPPNAVNLAVMNQCFATTAALTGFPVNQPDFIGATPVPFLFDPVTGSTFGAYSPTTCDGTQYQVRNQKDFSGEVRLVSNSPGPLSWQMGAYYLHIDRLVGVSLGADLGQGVIKNLYNPPNSTNPTSQLFADKFKTNVYAAFASADYAFSDQLKASLALRYDIEDRAVSNRVPVATDPITGGPINPGQAFGPIQDGSKSFKMLEPKLALSYKPQPNMNIYADWGVGFKSGGFNNQGSAAIVNANFNDGVTPGTIDADVVISDQYRKERSSAFEVGTKGSLLGGHVTYDLAGYYTRIRDMQFFEFFVGGFGLLRVVSNIDRVDVKGVELNLNARIVEGWSVFGAVNFTDSKIKKNSSRPDTVGNKSPYTADYTLNLGTQVEVPVSATMKLFARADYRLTGPTWFSTVQDQIGPTLFTGLIPISAVSFLPAEFGNADFGAARRDAFGVVNLRAGVEGANWKVTGFARNLFDEKYLNEVIPAIEFGGSFISPGERRIIGAELAVKF
ncbi:TonB-dependent receptor domain-containing protein [Sphingomonas sp.]|uniref:TonB-dependent receptor n=1 Tax=Sphingomonas sp. TaxID=28214 RepID=UPI00286CE21D|nr:TonB-dependent receptor [Sphingomonas sp.]